MSLYDFRWSKLLLANEDPPFYGLMMALIRRADTTNLGMIRMCWPEIVEEFERRYNAPGGVLPEDGPEVKP